MRCGALPGREVRVDQIRPLAAEQVLADSEFHRPTYSGHVFPLHVHWRFSMAVVEAGGAEILYGGRRYVAWPGDITVIPAGEPHAGRPSKRGLRYRTFLLPAPWVREVMGYRRVAGGEWSMFPCPVVRDPSLARILASLHRHLVEGADAESLLGPLGSALRRLKQRHGPTSCLAETASLPVRRVQRYVEDHYPEAIELEHLAEVAGWSRSHLVRRFRREIGLPPYRYLVCRRISIARHLIRKGEDIASVAYRVGFFDQSHLTRHFKRITGATPGSFKPPDG